MPPRPKLWIVAGPNGAGKTTCAQKAPLSQLITGVPFLNPDDRTREKLLKLGYAGFHDVPATELTRLFLEAAGEVESDTAPELIAWGGMGDWSLLRKVLFLRCGPR
jgi:hypothetical protein